jgi:hypothetical protein
MAAIKTIQLRKQVEGILKNYPDADIIGLKSANKWPSESTLEINGSSFLATQCVSQLSIREAILRAKAQDTRLVFVTHIEDPDLSCDLRAVLARRKLIPIKPWETVKDLFQANAIDGSVYQKQWVADVLLEKAPADGYKVAPSGFLSAERIWAEVLHLLLRIKTARPDAVDILTWSIDEKLVSQLESLSDTQFQDICQWIAPGPQSLECFLFTLLRDVPDVNAIALGLSLEVTTSELANDAEALKNAAIRIEKYTNNKPIPDSLRQKWYEAAYNAYQKLIETNQKNTIAKIQTRLDNILKETGIKDYAFLSSVSQLGFEQRLVQFAKAVTEQLKSKKSPDFKSLGQLLTFSEAHLSAARSPRRVDRMKMAFRLLKWLSVENKNQKEAPKAFFNHSENYLKDGGFVDRARDALSIGDECKELSQAYKNLIKQVQAIRETQNKDFAESLKKWTESGSESDALIKVEDFLKTILAPIAKHHRLLFIVLDGMNVSVFSELKDDLIWNDAWIEIVPECWEYPKPVIAALPTITETSRRSLIFGKLTASPKDDECKGFENNPALKEATGATPPKLFLKGEISSSEKHLSETLRNEIYSTRRKVVGTVVNAIDDSLYSNDQMSLSWRIEDIPILSQLLYAAREAGRIVIITSDHGHILDYHTKLYNYESGERWRPDDGNINDGEILIQGSRVLQPKSGKMIAPYNETIRYGKKKNGYHGGVSPQEVVIPFTIVKWQQIEKGWQGVPYYLPEWWDIRTDEPMPSAKESIVKRQKAPKTPESGQQFLFQEPQADELVESDSWIYDLLNSSVLDNQKKLCGRAVLSDELIYNFIKTVFDHGGTIIQSTLAQAIGETPMRMRGIISVMQRILNVDGYAVLTFDSASSTIKINKQLLKTQFKL